MSLLPPMPVMPLLRWFLALAAVTAALLPLRPSLDKAHVVLAYLLLNLAASARAGRRVGLLLSVVSFFCFNFFFVEPLHSFVVARPLDWLVLAALLITSAVAAHLLSKAQSEARTAWERADEIDRLAILGAESLNAGPTTEALIKIASVMQETLAADRCRIYAVPEANGTLWLAAERTASGSSFDAVADEDMDATFDESRMTVRDLGLPARQHLLQWVAKNGRVGVVRYDGSMRIGALPEPSVGHSDLDISEGAGLEKACALLLPLRVHERVVGVVRIDWRTPLELTAPRQRFLRALAYYAALGIERGRLVQQAEHAEALRQADTLKTAMLASVSHDLRTPLTTIKALANAIRLEGDDRAAIIEEEADRLNRFVADLLDLSRLDGGAVPITLQITAIEDLLGAALQRVSGALAHRVINVQLPPNEPLLLAHIDFTQSLRILVNLLENADKYSPAFAPIHVEVMHVGDEALITVSDVGPGIPAAERSRIFEPFQRLGTVPDSNGAGLGLSIARRLALLQGGSLEYVAPLEGGSRFVLSLRAADIDALASL